MDCQRVRLSLYALADDELDVADNLEVLDHVQSCPDCQAEWELDCRLKDLLQQHASAQRASPHLWPKIAAEIERIEGRRFAKKFALSLRQFRLAFRIAAVCLVILAVAGLSLSLLSSRESPALASEIVQDYLRVKVGLAEAVPAEAIPQLSDARIRDLGNSLGLTVSVPRLSGTKLNRLEASTCFFTKAQGVRITYASTESPRLSKVAYYQLRDVGGNLPMSDRLYIERRQHHNLVLWRSGPMLHALVSEGPADELVALASTLKP
ncbi:MAG: anti-sigma factor family protein [Candidatus Methylomirabilales bacterium]